MPNDKTVATDFAQLNEKLRGKPIDFDQLREDMLKAMSLANSTANCRFSANDKLVKAIAKKTNTKCIAKVQHWFENVGNSTIKYGRRIDGIKYTLECVHYDNLFSDLLSLPNEDLINLFEGMEVHPLIKPS